MADKDFRIDLILGAKFAEGFRAIDEAKRKLEGAERAAGKFSKTGAALGSALRTAGYAGIAAASAATALMGLYIQKTIEAEKVQAQLQARLKDTAGVAGRTLEQLNRQSKDLSHITVFDDESIGQVQAMLLTFTQIRGVNFDRTVESALNLATVLGTDGADAAKILGKALSDPEKGMSALSRAGVTFTDSQRDVIKKMVETGRVSEAQATLLDALRSKMGTAATAARNTLGGALQALKNAFDDVLEGDSGDAGIVGTRNAIENLIDTLNDPRTRQGVQQIITGIAQIVQKMAEALPAIAEFNARLEEAYGLTGQGGKRQANLADFAGGFTAGMKALAHGDIAGAQAASDRAYAGGLGGTVADFTNVAGDIDQNLVKAQQAAAKAAYDAAHPLVDHGGKGQFANVNGINVVPEGEGVIKPGKVPKASAGKKDDPDAAAKDYLADLQKQIALLGLVKAGEDDASEAAKAHYEVTEGKYKGASQALKDQIESAAQALDAQTKEREETEKAKEAYEDLRKELRTPAEIALDDVKAEVEILNDALQKGIITAAEYSVQIGKIADKAVAPLPNFQEDLYQFGIGDPAGDDFAARLKSLEDQYKQERDALNAAKSLENTDQAEWNRKSEDLERQHQEALSNLSIAQAQMRVAQISGAFASMAQIAKAFGGEQSRAYKVLFALSKGFAVAQAAVSLAINVAKASEAGFPANIGLIAAAFAQGAQIASILAGANYAGGGGGYAEGGYTGPGGKHEPAGIVHKGEGVLTQEEIAKLGGPAGFYALQEEIQAGRARAVLKGFADGGLVGLEDQNRTPMPDFAAMAPRGATVKNSMRVYLLNNEDDLAQRIASHPANEKAIVAVVSENGNAIKARW